MRGVRWTPELDSQLIAMVKQGVTIPDICKKLGKERGSILSRCAHFKLSLKMFNSDQGVRAGMKRNYKLAELPPLDRKFSEIGISLLSAAAHHCRWLVGGIGKDGHPKCCGEPVAITGISWCKAHALRCFEPEKERTA